MNTGRFSIEDLLRVAQAFAAAPKVMAELGVLLLNPNVELDEVAVHLKHDTALAARLLRIANSAFFAQSEPVASIENAAALIGLREIHRLVGAVAVDHFSLRNYPLYGIAGRRLRENALFVALLMEELADSVHENPQAAYTTGLFRSTGKLVLEKLATESDSFTPFQPDSDSSLVAWEKHTFGTTSNEAAAAILQQWRFPQEVSEAISGHYWAAGLDHPLTNLLNLAANMVEKLGYGLPGESVYWIEAEELYLSSGIKRRDTQHHIDRAFTAFERLNRAFG